VPLTCMFTVAGPFSRSSRSHFVGCSETERDG
jgi:hypothetical protein